MKASVRVIVAGELASGLTKSCIFQELIFALSEESRTLKCTLFNLGPLKEQLEKDSRVRHRGGIEEAIIRKHATNAST